MDETFFGKFMIMVVIDLQSGYLLLEDVADDRRKEMLGISEDIHPFSLNDNQIKPASQVENELENRAVKVLHWLKNMAWMITKTR